VDNTLLKMTTLLLSILVTVCIFKIKELEQREPVTNNYYECCETGMWEKKNYDYETIPERVQKSNR